MEPEVSLTFSQKPATYPCPDPVKSSPRTPSHSQIIRFNIVLPFPPSSSKRSPTFMLPVKFLYALTPPNRAKYPAHLILFDLIIRIFGEAYRSWSSSPFIPLHSHDTSSSAPYSRTPSACVLPSAGRITFPYWNTVDSGPNVGSHSLSSLCPEFLQEYREYIGALNIPPLRSWRPFLKSQVVCRLQGLRDFKPRAFMSLDAACNDVEASAAV